MSLSSAGARISSYAKDPLAKEKEFTEEKGLKLKRQQSKQQLLGNLKDTIETCVSFYDDLKRSNLSDLSENTQPEPWKVTLNGELVVELPNQFYALYNAIEESKYILELEENFDNEGSPPYEESVWRKAVKFITSFTLWMFEKTKKVIDAPEIHDGLNGSIDILWEQANYILLINIPKEPDKPLSFYGSDHKLANNKGTFPPFDPSKYHQIAWLFLEA